MCNSNYIHLKIYVLKIFNHVHHMCPPSLGVEIVKLLIYSYVPLAN